MNQQYEVNRLLIINDNLLIQREAVGGNNIMFLHKNLL